jgi:hypothetical protein
MKNKRVLNFSEFLNEVSFSDHYKQRTSNKGFSGNISNQSRILSRTKSPKYGWELVLKNDEKYINLKDFIEKSDKTQEQVEDLVSFSLHSILRSDYLNKLKPVSNKDYLLMYMGKIKMSNGEENATVYFDTGYDPQGQPYETAEGIYLTSSKIGSDYKAVTFYYLPPGKRGQNLFKEDFFLQKRRELGAKTKSSDLHKMYSFYFPYGEDFILELDLRKNEDEIKKSIKSQLNELNKNKEETEDANLSQQDNIDTSSPEMVGSGDNDKKYEIKDRSYTGQYTLAEDQRIGIIVPFIDKENFTVVEIKKILNLPAILASSKDAKEVKISYSIVEEEKKRRDSTGKELLITTTLTDNTAIIRNPSVPQNPKPGETSEEKRKREEENKNQEELPVYIEKKGESVIVPDKRIMERGNVAVWVKASKG